MIDRRIVVAAVAAAAFAVGWFVRPLVMRTTAAPAPAAAPVAAPRPPSPRKDVFANIYKNGTWGRNADNAGDSGTGSSAENTAEYRAFLAQFMAANHITSVVDAGCGDWEFSQLIDWTGIDYKGFDIVPELIERDQQKFARPNVQFFVGDIVDQDLPEGDLLICKHVLQHLPNADVQRFLARQVPRFKHVLLIDGIDEHTLSADNKDITAGGYRELDVTRPPFNQPGVTVLVYRDQVDAHQVLYIAGKR